MVVALPFMPAQSSFNNPSIVNRQSRMEIANRQSSIVNG
jgi:hypothetical protein